MRLLLTFWLLVGLGFAQTFEEFSKRLENIRSIRVSFIQKVSYPWSPKPELSKGVFYAQRGGKLRIEYTQPEKTLIVSDGSRIMVYSPEEKTAIVESLEKNDSSVISALFLFSKPLSEVFEQVGEIQRENTRVFVLKPSLRDRYFSKVYIEVLPSGNIKSVRVEEKEGITTTLEFVEVRTNFTPSEELFRVEPPKGATLIGR